MAHKLQAEVTRLELLRLQSIRDLTEAKRVEVALYWEKCFFSPEQRRAFLAYYDGKGSISCLHLHGVLIQVNRWGQHCAFWAMGLSPYSVCYRVCKFSVCSRGVFFSPQSKKLWFGQAFQRVCSSRN